MKFLKDIFKKWGLKIKKKEPIIKIDLSDFKKIEDEVINNLKTLDIETSKRIKYRFLLSSKRELLDFLKSKIKDPKLFNNDDLENVSKKLREEILVSQNEIKILKTKVLSEYKKLNYEKENLNNAFKEIEIKAKENHDKEIKKLDMMLENFNKEIRVKKNVLIKQNIKSILEMKKLSISKALHNKNIYEIAKINFKIESSNLIKKINYLKSLNEIKISELKKEFAAIKYSEQIDHNNNLLDKKISNINKKIINEKSKLKSIKRMHEEKVNILKNKISLESKNNKFIDEKEKIYKKLIDDANIKKFKLKSFLDYGISGPKILYNFEHNQRFLRKSIKPKNFHFNIIQKYNQVINQKNSIIKLNSIFKLANYLVNSNLKEKDLELLYTNFVLSIINGSCYSFLNGYIIAKNHWIKKTITFSYLKEDLIDNLTLFPNKDLYQKINEIIAQKMNLGSNIEFANGLIFMKNQDDEYEFVYNKNFLSFRI